jgi:hypothetical protein
VIEGLALGFVAGAALVGLWLNRVSWRMEALAQQVFYRRRDADRAWAATRELMVKQLGYEPVHADEVIEAWRANQPWLDLLGQVK